MSRQNWLWASTPYQDPFLSHSLLLRILAYRIRTCCRIDPSQFCILVLNCLCTVTHSLFPKRCPLFIWWMPDLSYRYQIKHEGWWIVACWSHDWRFRVVATASAKEHSAHDSVVFHSSGCLTSPVFPQKMMIAVSEVVVQRCKGEVGQDIPWWFLDDWSVDDFLSSQRLTLPVFLLKRVVKASLVQKDNITSDWWSFLRLTGTKGTQVKEK